MLPSAGSTNRKLRWTRYVAGFVLLLAPLLTEPFLHGLGQEKSAKSRHGMVVAVSPPAAEVGRDILLKGGNAVDAAVATAFAMAVTYPAAGNIGGGGFMVIHPPAGAKKDGVKLDPVVIEYRETAPLAATATMFKKGDSIYSCKCTGVPGTVRGLALAHARFGKLPWKEVLLPAVRLAEDGFLLSDSLAGSLNAVTGGDRSEMSRVLGKNQARDQWQAGDRLVQKDLAWSLRLIATEGPDAFYTGAIAGKLVAEMKANNGLITKEDLAAYRAKARKPIHGTFRGYDVYGPPPPARAASRSC